MDTRTSPFRLRIDKVRDELKRENLAAVLVPSSDPHLSEYLPARWQGRQWLSGFTGSMGTLVITQGTAALFADSRYWVQAEAELAGTGTELVKIPTGNSTAHVDWLASHPRRAAQALDGEWDLLLVDEAHHLSWSPLEASPAYELVDALASRTPALLLLTATPEH